MGAVDGKLMLIIAVIGFFVNCLMLNSLLHDRPEGGGSLGHGSCSGHGGKGHGGHGGHDHNAPGHPHGGHGSGNKDKKEDESKIKSFKFHVLIIFIREKERRSRRWKEKGPRWT